MTDLTKLIELQAAAPDQTDIESIQAHEAMHRNISEAEKGRPMGTTDHIAAVIKKAALSEKAMGFYYTARNFDFAALDEKIKRYEEALRFYANKGNWQKDPNDIDVLYERTPGGIAQEALEQ